MDLDVIYQKSCQRMNELPNEKINIRDKRGRFIAGIRYSPQTEFKKGQHWRKSKLFWNKDWLNNEYHNKQKSAAQIAIERNCTESNILFWLKKHNIQIRTMASIRKMKYWGLWGKQNGMYGKTGKENPNWNGGHSPERQRAYARSHWKELVKIVLRRDGYRCRNCGAGHIKDYKLNVHHIKEWSKYPELRFKLFNLITLCEEKCHRKKHKKKEKKGGDAS